MSKRDSTLTQKRLKEVLNYDPETGVFTWAFRVSKCIHIGNSAGYKNKAGYIFIRVDSKLYRAHRLAWFYMTGDWPNHEIDHIDCDQSNNKFSNLRDVDHFVNMQNTHKPRKHNKHGIQGVLKKRKKWQAIITVKGKRITIGTFDSKENAGAAYQNAKIIYHG